MTELKHYKVDYKRKGVKRNKNSNKRLSLGGAIGRAQELLMTDTDIDEVYIYAPVKIVRLEKSPVIIEDIDMPIVIDEDVKVEPTDPTSGSPEFVDNECSENCDEHSCAACVKECL